MSAKLTMMTMVTFVTVLAVDLTLWYWRELVWRAISRARPAKISASLERKAATARHLGIARSVAVTHQNSEIAAST